MNSQDKYDECLALLAEMHDISYMMIESGMDMDMDAITLIEEALKVIKSVDGGATKALSKPKDEPKDQSKTKKVLH
jgi:hypothetical protein